MDIKMLKCGCAGYLFHQGEHDGLLAGHPTCIVHETCEIGNGKILEGRMARCSYFGKTVKSGSYNGNDCGVCKDGGTCACEKPSSPNLWFFQSKPDKEFDEYYCACHGTD